MTAIVPANRPEISRETAIAWARAEGCTDDFFVLGRRGYFRRTMKTDLEGRGVYDDAIVVVTPDEIKTFNANTDPCKNQVGMACLQAGVWPMKRDVHKPGSPKAYPCFEQAAPVIVKRDGTEGAVVGFKHPKYGECVGGALWKGMFYIELHSGFNYETGSEGCQTIYKPQWLECEQAILIQMKARKMDVFNYVLSVRPVGE